jgi:hypothetical protein
MFQNCIEQQKGTVVFSNQKAKNSFFMRITSICLLCPLSILFFLFYQKYFFFKNTVGFLRSIFSRFIRNIFFFRFLEVYVITKEKPFCLMRIIADASGICKMLFGYSVSTRYQTF